MERGGLLERGLNVEGGLGKVSNSLYWHVTNFTMHIAKATIFTH